MRDAEYVARSTASSAKAGEAATVDAFWAYYRRCRRPLRAAIAHLTALALSPEPEEAARGTRLLFGQIVEPLCDAFTLDAAEAYRRAFAQVITAARCAPECRGLDVALAVRGIHSERDLLRSAGTYRRDGLDGGYGAYRRFGVHGRYGVRGAAASAAASRARVRRVTVLSRLTLGADVAVCLPMLARAARLFPNAEIRFVGGEGARIVAAGVRGVRSVRHVPADYGRNDRLVDRLNAWLGVCAAVADAGIMPPGESLVLDPDSRLTQLGLLPPAAGSDYYHFPSRTRGDGEPATLGALAVDWLDETFGAEEGGGPVPAVLEMAPRDAEWSRALRAALVTGAGAGRAPAHAGGCCRAKREQGLRADRVAAQAASRADGVFVSSMNSVSMDSVSAPRAVKASRIAAVSFGVGGNDRKRVGPAFEVDLVAWLAARGWCVLLARGSGAAEVARGIDLGERLAARGVDVLHLERGRHLPGAGRSASAGCERVPEVVTWEADVGAFLAAIACADIYVGYDSAGQHLAAALGVPTLSIFVEAAGPRHALRWTPRGRAAGALRVVRSPYPANERTVLERAKAEFVRLADERADAEARSPFRSRLASAG
jgi:hypothetical protein